MYCKSNYWFLHQIHIMNPFKHLRWSFLWKKARCCKKLHLRCFNGFWVCLCMWYATADWNILYDGDWGIIHLSTCINLSEKLTFLTPWYAHVRTSAYQGARNVSFSENFAYILNGWLLVYDLPTRSVSLANGLFSQNAKLIFARLIDLTHFSPVSHFYTPWKRQKWVTKISRFSQLLKLMKVYEAYLIPWWIYLMEFFL